MKQIIVMVAMVVLGIAIAGFIGQYKSTIEKMTTNTNKKIESSCNFSYKPDISLPVEIS